MNAVTVEILHPTGYHERYKHHLITLHRIQRDLQDLEALSDLAAARIINIVFGLRRRSLPHLAWELTEKDLFNHFKTSRYSSYESFMVQKSKEKKRTRRKRS